MLIYLGVFIVLNVFVVGMNVLFKWIFGDGMSMFYVFNIIVVY